MKPGFKAPAIAITQEADDQKKALTTRAASITTVTNDETQQSAVEVVRDLKALSNSVEATRKELKEPLLALGKEIDNVAKTFTADVDAEVNRLQNACGSFLRQKREEQERVEAEERRKREEALAAARAEEEKLRKKLESEQITEAERGKLEKKLDKVNVRAAVEIQASQQRELEAQANQTKGTQLRKRYKAQVVDAKLAFAARPDLFDITLSASKVQAALKLDEAGTLKTPGMFFEEDIKLAIGAR